MQDLDRQQKDRKWLKLIIIPCSFFLIGLTLLALWNLFLVGEIKKSRTEREGLKEDMEKMEIMEKVNRNFIKDVLRQKAIALCFWELIRDHEEKFTNKEKQDCIQLIVMADEKYGNKGLSAPLILAWLEKESRGDPKAISEVGAKGLTQWMDYRAWNILTEMGYPGYDKNLIFNPIINLTGGLYYLNSLMNFWEWKGVKDQIPLLFYTLHSYKWGPENAEELYINGKKASGPSAQYVDWILKRREHWENKLKYWVDDAQKLAKKWEEKRMP